MRAAAGLAVEDVGAPIDVLWFRVGRDPGSEDSALARVAPGHFVVTIDRGDYWQCAFVIPKGGAEALQRQPIEVFRAQVVATAPLLAAAHRRRPVVERRQAAHRRRRPAARLVEARACSASAMRRMRCRRWAASASTWRSRMRSPPPTCSPTKLRAGGALTEDDLDEVRRRRLWPTKATQAMQVAIQNNVLVRVMASRAGEPLEVPLPLRVLTAVPTLQRLFARLLGMGVRPEHVRSPEA